MKPILAAIATLALASSGGSANAKSAPRAPHYVGQELARTAHFTIAQARTIALRAYPGRITDQELEREGGGSGLRYSSDIVSRGRTHEVGVDAMTGAVLENKLEGNHPD